MFALLTFDFRVAVSPRGSPLFTVALVHGWYMNALLDLTTVGGHLKIREPRHGQIDDEIVAIHDVHVGRSCVLQSPPLAAMLRVGIAEVEVGTADLPPATP
jgi:hypothetical protein